MNPIVIVIRDPDASNQYQVFDGEAETYDIDCGYSDLDDHDEFMDWAESHLGDARTMAAARPHAAAFIRGVVLEYAEWKGHSGDADFVALAEQTAPQPESETR